MPDQSCKYASGMASSLPKGHDFSAAEIDQGHRKLDFAGDAERGNITAGQDTAEQTRRQKAIMDMYPETQD